MHALVLAAGKARVRTLGQMVHSGFGQGRMHDGQVLLPAARAGVGRTAEQRHLENAESKGNSMLLGQDGAPSCDEARCPFDQWSFLEAGAPGARRDGAGEDAEER